MKIKVENRWLTVLQTHLTDHQIFTSAVFTQNCVSYGSVIFMTARTFSSNSYRRTRKSSHYKLVNKYVQPNPMAQQGLWGPCVHSFSGGPLFDFEPKRLSIACCCIQHKCYRLWQKRA